MSRDKEREGKQWIRERGLGAGAFGLVELFKNTENNEIIAIKRCHVSASKLTSRQVERWIQEVEIMNSLNHPNIVSTRKLPKDLDQPEERLPVLCMEYCNRGDLRTVLNDPKNFCGLREQEVRAVMTDVSSAVEYLHGSKVTHRDLKPENVVLQQTKDRIVYKLIDLGYAKELDEASVSASLVGTLNYVAPELLWRQRYSSTVDYWSLGILFYEVVTGVRPFLPGMPMTKTWLEHVHRKKYEDISAREINGKIEFYQDIQGPSHISECLRCDLVHWFRVALQWDPRARGRIESGGNDVVIFTMLKSILEKKIIRVFVCPLYKFDYFSVNNSSITVAQLKEIIQSCIDPALDPKTQILTDSTGKLLCNEDFFTQSPDDCLMIFKNDDFCIKNIPKIKLPLRVEEMLAKPREDCDYQTLREYYGATLFFIQHEVDLYRSYILALGIMIDLCDSHLQTLNRDVNRLTAAVEVLNTEFLHFSQKPGKSETNAMIEDLGNKINIFLRRIGRLKEEFDVLSVQNTELKTFSDVSWMSEISKPLDGAINLLNDSSLIKRNSRDKPRAMVKLVFDFLAARNRQLQCVQLQDSAQSIMQLQRKLMQMEEVLKSVHALSYFYCDEVKKLSSNSAALLRDKSPPRALQATDTDIYDSIVIKNMIGCLLTEMDMWKRKFASLSHSND